MQVVLVSPATPPLSDALNRCAVWSKQLKLVFYTCHLPPTQQPKSTTSSNFHTDLVLLLHSIFISEEAFKQLWSPIPIVGRINLQQQDPSSLSLSTSAAGNPSAAPPPRRFPRQQTDLYLVWLQSSSRVLDWKIAGSMEHASVNTSKTFSMKGGIAGRFRTSEKMLNKLWRQRGVGTQTLNKTIHGNYIIRRIHISP